MTFPASTRLVPPKDGYHLWSRTYDTERNPMLSIEQRFLEPLLPRIEGLDIVDLGCGTGRWLARFAGRKPRSLLGIDFSPDMLEQASRKLGSAAKFIEGNCEALSLPPSCSDLILCSFLLSYVENVSVFAQQVRQMIRPDGSVFVTDLHPATVSALNWRRGFDNRSSFLEIATQTRTMEQVISLFEDVGLYTHAVLEPHFGNVELQIFEAAGKQNAFHASSGHPAIYILQLRPSPARSNQKPIRQGEHTSGSIYGARLAIGSQESVQGELGFSDGRIEFLGSKVFPLDTPVGRKGTSIDLSGFLVFPGLINAHDHLEFALYPRLGKGGYRNFVEWAEDIHSSEGLSIHQHRAVPRDVRLWWGGIRNLLCGVTTVCHHNPYEAEVFEKHFVIRVLKEFGWAHSLAIESDVTKKRSETRWEQPFIIHLAEGVDEKSADEIFHLLNEKALDNRTVIVHGLGLDERGKELLRSVGAGLIWCPTSNIFLFGRTLPSEDIRTLPAAALGSDSPLTARGDLLDEVRAASEVPEISSEDLFGLVTVRAAQLLRLQNGEGTLRAGSYADLIAVRDTDLSPAPRLATLSYKDVELVMVGGRVHLASSDVKERLPRNEVSGLEPLAIEGLVRWIRAPLDRLFAETKMHLTGEIQLGGKRINHGSRA
jgi:cytosine/adenosine deaminase-related metal-dependent hydrolase/ubiquinone/menaquinone biosynthesis C-methylase UbiE